MTRATSALAERVRTHWRHYGQAGQLVMSFHGVPERTLKLGDPYHCECHKTARLLAEKLGLGKDRYKVTFQSRFGKAKWLEPYTEPTLIRMAQAGIERVDVVCPGFTGDCLETLEEISMEARHAFLKAGGKEFHYIECLNDSPTWIAALAEFSARQLAGWPTQAPGIRKRCASQASVPWPWAHLVSVRANHEALPRDQTIAGLLRLSTSAGEPSPVTSSCRSR